MRGSSSLRAKGQRLVLLRTSLVQEVQHTRQYDCKRSTVLDRALERSFYREHLKGYPGRRRELC
jgi:hypothetical protein